MACLLQTHSFCPRQKEIQGLGLWMPSSGGRGDHTATVTVSLSPALTRWPLGFHEMLGSSSLSPTHPWGSWDDPPSSETGSLGPYLGFQGLGLSLG